MDLTGRLTKQGQALLSQVLVDGTLTVTRVVAGCGTTAQDAAELEEPRQAATISERTTDGALSTLVVTLAAAQADRVYTLTELGVYARDTDGAEILYQIYRLDQPVEISPDSRLVLRTYLRLTASDDLEVALSLPPSGLLVEADIRTKADLIDGYVPVWQLPRLNTSRKLYVDPETGSDKNPGTQDLPLRTIQAALDILPKDLGASAGIICLAEGTYDETVYVTGFTGGNSGGIRIVGTEEQASQSHRIKALVVEGNAALVFLSGITVYGNKDGMGIMLHNSNLLASYVRLEADSGSRWGIYVGYFRGPSSACLKDCVVDGYPGTGIVAGGASVLSVEGGSIQNCTIGLQAGDEDSSSAGIVITGAVPPSFTGNITDTKVCGGSILSGL